VTLHWQQGWNCKNEQTNNLFSGLMAGEIGHDAQRAEYYLPEGAFQTGFSLFLAQFRSHSSTSNRLTIHKVL